MGNALNFSWLEVMLSSFMEHLWWILNEVLISETGLHLLSATMPSVSWAGLPHRASPVWRSVGWPNSTSLSKGDRRSPDQGSRVPGVLNYKVTVCLDFVSSCGAHFMTSLWWREPARRLLLPWSWITWISTSSTGLLVLRYSNSSAFGFVATGSFEELYDSRTQ